MSERLNEEARSILRKIVESLAWRQIAAVNVLGHCLKYVNDLDTKLRVATELDLNLRLLRETRDLYKGLGWTDLDSAVRERVASLPYPESRLEFGLCYYITGLAEQVAMESYASSASQEFAAIALSYVDAAPGRPEPTRFVEFACDPGNKPLAQQYLTRWILIAMPAFGRAGSVGDERAVALGLRTRTSAEMRREFVARIAPFVERCGLVLPEWSEAKRV